MIHLLNDYHTMNRFDFDLYFKKKMKSTSYEIVSIWARGEMEGAYVSKIDHMY